MESEGVKTAMIVCLICEIATRKLVCTLLFLRLLSNGLRGRIGGGEWREEIAVRKMDTHFGARTQVRVGS